MVQWFSTRPRVIGYTDPTLFTSINRGATARTYVHVQMKSRMTSSSDWKLKRADLYFLLLVIISHIGGCSLTISCVY